MSSCRRESLRWANCFFSLLSTHVFQTPAVTYSVYWTTYTLLISYHRPKRKYNIVQQPKRALTQKFQRQKGQKKNQRKQKRMTKKGRQIEEPEEQRKKDKKSKAGDYRPQLHVKEVIIPIQKGNLTNIQQKEIWNENWNPFQLTMKITFKQ